ncbi:MAG: holo-ACP synthase [Synergistaceae bacterium]|jgi:holo-[acyl-carrier protein] synthase|nr:holo-ACP synthase [Synergistaceae bacterium]
MIIGVGTDLCSISRMKRAVKSDHFVLRVFSGEEIDYAMSRSDPSSHFASSYAAKEALAKASGFGVFVLGMAESWVRRTETGPVMMMSDGLRGRLMGGDAGKCWLSLTHEGDYALAFVVLEREP